ncbi:uncharacterized protein V6R79_005252 [Siganus canaliculatus]
MAGGSGSVRMAVLMVAITVMLHSAQEVFGSGKEVESMITNNCENYKTNSTKDPDRASIDCTVFLEKFKSAFVNKDPKTITPESYHDLMETFKPLAHENKYLFWSGPAALVFNLIETKNNTFYNIHDTAFGFLRGVEDFCGQEGSNEIITRGCPDEPFKSYWKATSRAFAKAATGTVMVVLHDYSFYPTTRYFATDELPYFNRNTVTELRVLMVIQKLGTIGMAGESGSVRMAVLLVAITVMLHSAQEVCGITGKELEKEITEHCNYYKTKTDPQKDPDHAKLNCDEFLELFKSAFVGKDPKTMVPEAYNGLMNKMKVPEHEDRYLFWSGTEDMVQWLIAAQKNYYFYHLYDAVFGIMNVNAAWCGRKGSTEIITDNNCPEFESPVSAVKCYWRAASRTFTLAATGDVMVLLNDKIFYDPKSFFATDELPYFNRNKVTALRVLIVTTDATKGSDLKNKDPMDWWNTALILRMTGGSGSMRMALLLVAITVMLHSAQEVFGMDGKEFETMITKNCNDYKSKKGTEKDPNYASVDCEAFLERFKSAFVGKNPKKVTPESYNDLMEYVTLPTHEDKYLFWCKTGDLFAGLIFNKNNYFYHIQDTVFGFLNIPEKWCGKEGSKGCPENPYISYWQAASKAFAQAATGDVTVLLSDKNFYISDSFFGNDELPNLNSNTVTQLRVLLVLEKQRKVKDIVDVISSGNVVLHKEKHKMQPSADPEEQVHQV